MRKPDPIQAIEDVSILISGQCHHTSDFENMALLWNFDGWFGGSLLFVDAIFIVLIEINLQISNTSQSLGWVSYHQNNF